MQVVIKRQIKVVIAPQKKVSEQVSKPDTVAPTDTLQCGPDIAQSVSVAPAPVASEPQEVIKPQPGPQTAFFESSADIVIYGGAAGGGKSYALMLEALRHIFTTSGMTAVIFRQQAEMLRQAGGLWEKARKLYLKFEHVTARESPDMSFTFPPFGNKVILDSCISDAAVESHQGGEYAYLALDELTHFTEYQFFYLLSRNRSSAGIKSYTRCSCNPDSESWVARFIAWWIDQETGYPVPERDGVIRHMMRVGDDITWHDTEQTVIDPKTNKPITSKTVTFIKADLNDNQILLNSDPTYISTLYAMASVERERLLRGNWKIAQAGGSFFKTEWWKIIDQLPAGLPLREICYWDRAATEKKADNDPDFTCGVRMVRYPGNTYVITRVIHFRGAPLAVRNAIKNDAAQHLNSETWLEQEPGAAGVNDIADMRTFLDGFAVFVAKPTQDKATRALPLSSAVEPGRVVLLRGAWNSAFISEMAAFGPDPKKYAHDDQVDAATGAYNSLNNASAGPRILDL